MIKKLKAQISCLYKTLQKILLSREKIILFRGRRKEGKQRCYAPEAHDQCFTSLESLSLSSVVLRTIVLVLLNLSNCPTNLCHLTSNSPN